MTYSLLYGESKQHLRHALWLELQTLLQSYKNYMIIGDINQVENYSDKLRGSPVIWGWQDFTNWKHLLNL